MLIEGNEEQTVQPIAVDIDMSKEIVKLNKSEKLDMAKYKPEDVVKANAVARTLDSKDVNSILNFGLELQNNLSNYSSEVLSNIRASDSGEVGAIINDLLNEIHGIDVDKDKNMLMRIVEKIPFVKTLVKNTRKMLSQYDKVSTNVDNIVLKLDKSRVTIFKDNNTLGNMFEKNINFVEDLNVHILAAKLREKELEAEIEKMETSGDFEQYELADTKSFLGRLKKKTMDLELTKTVAVQSLPQIRIIQDNNSVIVEKIQSSIVNTIPLWKNQIVIALALDKQKRVLELNKRINETTSQLLRKNSELLKTNSVETAKQNEEAIVNVEDLKKVNADLVSTLEEIQRIKDEGDQKRLMVRKELQQIDEELKKRILNVKNLTTEQSKSLNM